MQISNLLRQNVAGKLFNHGIVFLINIEIVRILGASVSGFYFNELYLINFFAFMGSIGLDYAAIAWIANQPQLQHKIHRVFLLLMLCFGLLVLMLATSVFPILHLSSQQPTLAIVLFGTGNLLLILFQGMLSALKKFRLQNKILVITNGLFFICLCCIELFQIENALTIISVGYGMLFFVQGLTMCMMSYAKKESNFEDIDWAPFFKYGLNIMLTSLVFYAFLRVDNFFVEKYCSAVELSNYVQCGKVGQYFLYFASIVSSTLLPFFAEQKMENNFDDWKMMIRPYVLLMLIGMILIAVFGKFAFPFLFGISFNLMHGLMLVLLPGYFCLGMLTLVNVIYLGNKNIKRIVIGDSIGLLMVVVFDAIFIPQYGVYAAAIISSIVYCIVFLIVWLGAKKQFHS
jgi:hypothetical protein